MAPRKHTLCWTGTDGHFMVVLAHQERYQLHHPADRIIGGRTSLAASNWFCAGHVTDKVSVEER